MFNKRAADLLGIELTLPLAARPLIYVTRCPHSAFTNVNYENSKRITSRLRGRNLGLLKSTSNSKDVSIQVSILLNTSAMTMQRALYIWTLHDSPTIDAVIQPL